MKLSIKTVYYRRGQDPKITRAGNANRAVATCILHMQINQYGAHVAEVYDDDSGELHAQIKYSVVGTIKILYSRDPLKYETKYASGYLLGL